MKVDKAMTPILHPEEALLAWERIDNDHESADVLQPLCVQLALGLILSEEIRSHVQEQLSGRLLRTHDHDVRTERITKQLHKVVKQRLQEGRVGYCDPLTHLVKRDPDVASFVVRHPDVIPTLLDSAFGGLVAFPGLLQTRETLEPPTAASFAPTVHNAPPEAVVEPEKVAGSTSVPDSLQRPAGPLLSSLPEQVRLLIEELSRRSRSRRARYSSETVGDYHAPPMSYDVFLRLDAVRKLPPVECAALLNHFVLEKLAEEPRRRGQVPDPLPQPLADPGCSTEAVTTPRIVEHPDEIGDWLEPWAEQLRQVDRRAIEVILGKVQGRPNNDISRDLNIGPGKLSLIQAKLREQLQKMSVKGEK